MSRTTTTRRDRRLQGRPSAAASGDHASSESRSTISVCLRFLAVRGARRGLSHQTTADLLQILHQQYPHGLELERESLFIQSSPLHLSLPYMVFAMSRI